MKLFRQEAPQDVQNKLFRHGTNTNYHLLNNYLVPGTVLRTFPILHHLM